MPKTSVEFVTTFSNYRSITLRDQGGSGVIYEVKNELDEKYALKLLKNQNITSNKRKRFQNEINFCQRENHPNIIRVLDHGIYLKDGISVPFYIMPLFDSSLRILMEEGINPNNIIPLFSQLLDGIEAAHFHHIVHRDLKPENVLCQRKDMRLLVADFGIARFLEDELYTAVETKEQDRLANFQYAAPEQRVRGKQVDSRADIYAAGLILNEMFTHEIPQGTGYKQISSISSEYSYLDEIVGKMIRQNPEDRLHSVAEVKQLLKYHGAEFITTQKLSSLQAKVIPESEIDDPLVINPIKIEDFEWEKNKLTLILNHPINQRWKNALYNMGSHSSVLGKGPEAFTFERNLAIILSDEYLVQPIIDHFKNWIPLATRQYAQSLIDEQKQREEQERQEIKKAIEAEEAKSRLRKSIKL